MIEKQPTFKMNIKEETCIKSKENPEESCLRSQHFKETGDLDVRKFRYEEVTPDWRDAFRYLSMQPKFHHAKLIINGTRLFECSTAAVSGKFAVNSLKSVLTLMRRGSV